MAKNQLIALEASSASITTASVTIRTLRVDSRQLTMGTFRQLRQRPLIDEREIKLLGTVWGWVNYNPDGGSSTTQFIVQFGEELCRCGVFIRDMTRWNSSQWTNPFEETMDAFSLAAGSYILSLAVHGKLTNANPTDERLRYRLKDRPFFGEYIVEIGTGCDIDSTAKYAMVKMVNPTMEQREWIVDKYVNRPSTQDEIGKEIESRREILRSILVKRDRDEAGNPPEWWDNMLDQLARSAADYAGRWNELMGRLRSVEQLFIAT